MPIDFKINSYIMGYTFGGMLHSDTSMMYISTRMDESLRSKLSKEARYKRIDTI